MGDIHHEHIAPGVDAVRTTPRRRRQQADDLVVADGLARRAGERGELADVELRMLVVGEEAGGIGHGNNIKLNHSDP